jgi:hypothetical protein
VEFHHINPSQIPVGQEGVADYHRRFGLAPTPVHARVVNSSRTLYSDVSASVVAQAALDADTRWALEHDPEKRFASTSHLRRRFGVITVDSGRCTRPRVQSSHRRGCIEILSERGTDLNQHFVGIQTGI